MSIKPQIIDSVQLAEQTQKLQKQVYDLEHHVQLLEKRLESIQRSVGENEQLKQAVHKLLEESLQLTLAEWEKRKELYPEIRMGILMKAAEILVPPKKDKAPGPGGAKP